jgi:hypothetical protein
MLWVCGNPECRAAFAVGTETCPQCGTTEGHYEQGSPDDPDRQREENDMAKISKAGGPTNIDDPNLPPHIDPDTGDRLDNQDVEDQVNADDASEYDFDPSQHTVAEVNEYLDACDDDAEKRRVLDAERAGQNRKGVAG